MPADDNQKIPITTPQQHHEAAASKIASSLGQVLGSDQPQPDAVMAKSAEDKSPEMEQLQETVDRIFLNKPGYEPSKSFLEKMWERIKKKHPDSAVTLKED